MKWWPWIERDKVKERRRRRETNGEMERRMKDEECVGTNELVV